MKRQIFPLFLFCFLAIFVCLQCSRKIQGDEHALDLSELVFTDSFSPVSYEYPLSRKVVKMVDTDIGAIIDQDTTNPLWRNIYSTVDQFFQAVSTDKAVKPYFTDSSFNSFFLRYRDGSFSGRYRLRISAPENDFSDRFWISFKITVKGKKYIGRLELVKNKDSFLIGDFENKGFDTIFFGDKE